MNMVKKEIHTTIPIEYYTYGKRNHLSWSELLKKAIENEMSHDPNALQAELEKIKAKEVELLEKLKTSKKKDKNKTEQMKAMRQGLMPV